MGIQSPKHFFCFQDVSDVNGIHKLFTIEQIPMQLQCMILWGHNGTIPMDVTFGTKVM
jgi:hypothetical protein